MITTLQWPSKLAPEPAPLASSRNTAADARRTIVILEGYGFDAWGFIILSPVGVVAPAGRKTHLPIPFVQPPMGRFVRQGGGSSGQMGKTPPARPRLPSHTGSAITRPPAARLTRAAVAAAQCSIKHAHFEQITGRPGVNPWVHPRQRSHK